jgi:hypothetical protein
MLLFDLVIFGLTLYRVVTVRRVGSRSLFDIIIRDGELHTLYLVESSHSSNQAQRTLG